MSKRDINKKCRKKEQRQQVEIRLLPFRTEPMTRGEALIAQAGGNNFIPESLEVRAGRALEMQEAGLKGPVIVTMLARGGGQPVIDDLVAWAKVFPLLSEEAAQRANAGTLTLGRARKLAKLRAEEQDKILLRPRPAKDKTVLRPASPVRVRALVKQLESDQRLPTQFSRVEVLMLLRVLSGNAAPDLLDQGTFAAWNRAGEDLKSRKS